jgi:5-methylcytosine-specific restriction endonuclease McrA
VNRSRWEIGVKVRLLKKNCISEKRIRDLKGELRALRKEWGDIEHLSDWEAAMTDCRDLENLDDDAWPPIVASKMSAKFGKAGILGKITWFVPDFLALIETRYQRNEPQAVSGWILAGYPDESAPSPVRGERGKESPGGVHFYLYKGNLYCCKCEPYTREEEMLAVKEHYFKEQSRFKKIRKEIKLLEKLESEEIVPREPIPEAVRFAVWRRDGGKCVKCAGKKSLEFEHIIPVSKGGSNTERNIQILCEKCNRTKSDKI